MVVAFDALGGGKAADTTNSNPNNATWSHTATGSDRAVLVIVGVKAASGISTDIVRSATYGGVAMTELQIITSGTNHLIFFGLLNPATGAQTVAVNLSGVATGSSGNSVSYTGVDSFGTISTTSGSAAGTAMSHGVTGSAVGRSIAQAFLALNATLGSQIINYTPTSRFSIAVQSWSPAINAGDAAGAAGTVTFTANRGSGVQWRSIAVDLIEAVAATNTGAFFAMF